MAAGVNSRFATTIVDVHRFERARTHLPDGRCADASRYPLQFTLCLRVRSGVAIWMPRLLTTSVSQETR